MVPVPPRPNPKGRRQFGSSSCLDDAVRSTLEDRSNYATSLGEQPAQPVKKPTLYFFPSIHNQSDLPRGVLGEPAYVSSQVKPPVTHPDRLL